jgi:hypothetical protein
MGWVGGRRHDEKKLWEEARGKQLADLLMRGVGQCDTNDSSR